LKDAKNGEWGKSLLIYLDLSLKTDRIKIKFI